MMTKNSQPPLDTSAAGKKNNNKNRRKRSQIESR